MAKKKTKKQLEHEKLMAKADAYEIASEAILDMLWLYTLDDGTVVNIMTEEVETFDEKILKRHTRQHIATINRRSEMELDLLTGNTKVAQYFFEKFLNEKGLDFVAYGIEIENGSKLKEIPDYYAWTIIIACPENEEYNYELKSKYYKNRNLGLMELIMILSNNNKYIPYLGVIDM